MLPAFTLNSTRSTRSSVLPRAHARTAKESDADSAVNGHRRSSRAQRPTAAARAAAPNVMDHDGAWRGSGAAPRAVVVHDIRGRGAGGGSRPLSPRGAPVTVNSAVRVGFLSSPSVSPREH